MTAHSIAGIVPDWAKELPVAITVTDKNAGILYMNDRAMSTFSKPEESSLIGKSLFDCHNPHSAAVIRQLLETGSTNVYTIEKKGVKKLIWQSAWFAQGEVSGLVEISIVLNNDMPHFIRQ